ncbi:MAG: YlmC/YmxH family sporulation protein [Firmicutes bacterium]|nr:YlmC/YmxH family sporulation protein [Bacillota bacterium]
MELMRFSELANKEVINVDNGKCMGIFADCDIRIDPKTGKILEIILTGRSGWVSLFLSSGPAHVIPWESVIRIGVDTIIVTLGNSG